MNESSTTLSDNDKNRASMLMLVAAIVMGVMGLLAFVLGGAVFGIIDFAIAGVIVFFGRARVISGDYGTAKLTSLICAGVMGLLGLLALGLAGAGGGLGLLVALIVLGSAGGLVYAAMLISPGKKLF